MHPKEDRKIRIGTGRLAHLSLPCSELHVGVDLDHHPRVAALLADGTLDCRLVFPGAGGENLSHGDYRPRPGRRPVFFLIDGTWPCARTILRRSPAIRRLPRVTFDVTTPSAFVIKRQPRPDCLSTLEAAERCMALLNARGHEQIAVEQRQHLLAPLHRLMEIQMGYPGAPVTGPSGYSGSGRRP